MTFASGSASVIGALVGGNLLGGDAGFFGGGLLAGLVAVLASGQVAVWLGCVPPRRRRAVVTGATVGLICAALVSAVTAFTFLIPLLSFLLVGAGAMLADVDAATNERRAMDAPVV